MSLLDQAGLRRVVERLAAVDRASASPGARQAAEWVAAELREAGAAVRLQPERVHGTYWWPVGLLCGLAALAGLSGRRRLGGAVAAVCAGALTDDLWVGRRWFRRWLLPRRTAVNVVGELGSPAAERVVVFHAHHDAAHSGLVFDPAIPRALAGRFPGLAGRVHTTPPFLWSVVAAPALVASGALAGSRRLRLLGMAACAGTVLTMADIGRSAVVPGAVDNLSGVAVLLSLAHALGAESPPGVRVILLSTDSEESFLEGMQAWARRWLPGLAPDRTCFVCLESLGSSRLIVLDGEGLLKLHRYPADLQARVRSCAEALGIELEPRFRFRFATDGQVPLLAGYPAVAISSIDWYRAPRNYHWPTDAPEHVDYGSVAAAARLALALLRDLERSWP